MRFASHRDVARAVERGVRKAGLPIAYSAGFSPHPRISYAGGVPTGVASEAEYLEISLTRQCEPPEVLERLDGALPDGIDVIEVREPPATLPGDGGSPAGLRLEASEWRVVLPGIAPAVAATAVRAFLAEESVEVERLTSKGVRRMDARGAVVSLRPERRAGDDPDTGCAILRMVVRHVTPAVRPDDILAALRRVAPLPLSSPPLVTRLAQGPLGMVAVAQAAAPPPGLSGAQGQEKATRLAATETAVTPAGVGAGAAVSAAADAAVTQAAGAYEPLPRGAGGPATDLRARESDGRLPACSTPSDRTNSTTATGQGPLARPTA